jgi:Core binding factor beta subunit
LTWTNSYNDFRKVITLSLPTDTNLQELKQAIERGYVLLKFTDTRGGTELGVRLDNTATDLSGADFGQSTGIVHLAGNLTLNYVPVRHVAEVDLATLGGTGHLEILE